MSDFMQEVDPDDWWERTKENPSDPLSEIRQQHEAFLNDLEGLAVEALASGDWSKVDVHINQVRRQTDLSDCFNSPEEYDGAIAFISRILGEASTKSLSRSGADLLQTTEPTINKD